MALILNRNYEKYSEQAPFIKHRSVIKPEITVAGILKSTTYDNLMYECSILNLTGENRPEILKEKPVDLLLVDMTDADEHGMADKIKDCLKFCMAKKIPTVFWDTDYNGIFNENLELVRQFDTVFTIHSGRINEYKKVLRRDRVFYLPFAVQPRLHNPIEKNIMNKADSLSADPDINLDRIPGTANKIYSLQRKNEIHREMTSVPTVLFEGPALGLPVISPYSNVLVELCPQIVKLYKSKDEYTGILESLMKNKDEVDKLSVLGQRAVFSSHTYTNRMKAILEKTGMTDTSSVPGVSMVSATNKIDSMDTIFENYECQNYQNKELIIVLNNNKLDLEEWKSRASEYPNVKVFQLDESQPLGRCLNLAVDNCVSPYISKCDDDNYYGPNFLSDLMNVYQYADSEIVGKLNYYCYLEGCRILALMCPHMEYRYVNMLSGSAFIAKREVFDEIRFTDKPAGSDTVFFRECISKGVRMYSADRFNYVYRRHASMHLHTWKMSDEVFLKSCKIVDITDDYIERVTI